MGRVRDAVESTGQFYSRAEAVATAANMALTRAMYTVIVVAVLSLFAQVAYANFRRLIRGSAPEALVERVESWSGAVKDVVRVLNTVLMAYVAYIMYQVGQVIQRLPAAIMTTLYGMVVIVVICVVASAYVRFS